MLPNTFGPVQHDEQGRAYVVHKPSGVIYFVKDEVVRRGRATGATVTTYTPSQPHVDMSMAHKQRKPARQHSLALVPPRVINGVPVRDTPPPRRDVVEQCYASMRKEPTTRLRDEKPPQAPRVNHARFIPGSEPRS